jgi:hypothetical protein
MANTLHSPDKNTVCQAACWTKQSRYNSKYAVYGYDALESYDSALEKIVLNSWDHYNALGNESYQPDSALNEGMFKSGDMLLHIPVCYSNYSTIWWENGQISKFHHSSPWGVGEHRKSQTAFPFACGKTFRSEESKEFLTGVNVNMLQEHTMRKDYLAYVSNFYLFPSVLS